MSSSTILRDQQVSHLGSEVDGEFAPLSDAVDAASNVLEAFGASTGDPNAQAAIIGPKLRETYDEVYERVLALVSGHKMQTSGESPGDMVQRFDELFRPLVELASVSMTMEGFVARGQLRKIRGQLQLRRAPGQPMKVEVAWCVLTLRDELEEVCKRVYRWEAAMGVCASSEAEEVAHA